MRQRQRGKAVKAEGLREYNIVTNRYLELHDLKEQTNDDIQRAEAARAYWKQHDYDLIRGSFYDQEKETTFVKARDDEAKIHGKDQVKKLPLTVQK